MKLTLKDLNGKIYKLNDKVYNPYTKETYMIKWNGYSYYADGFYNSCQDNPEDFFAEGYYKNCKII